ncbi:uncharacterized protein B0H18DRAFT_886137 [Fomitopsis serialis]|uniref:uncharacterized protein n=1 Tax=Fomitopsis serialis TaxID=139415 RepID=UPI002007AE29|nr:uncharacterized protein B0H18DRAFT_886137 [Neoantrodia serialis]KAH9915217.1 hypothetical protein B0H18DRAFT_886137 [Neoantrodia serialis]
MQSVPATETSSYAGSASSVPPGPQPQDCLACRIIGTGALAGVGVHALNLSRAHQPGSPMGKRIMAGLGVCFLAGSYMRWTN